MTLKGTKELCAKDLEELFHSVGWDLITPTNTLQSAMLHASHVITAWEDNKLVGLIRSMDDGCWHANIDCLVVHKDYQKRGIGTALIEQMMETLRYIDTISVNPNERTNFSLYKRYGFLEIENGGLLQWYNAKEIL